MVSRSGEAGLPGDLPIVCIVLQKTTEFFRPPTKNTIDIALTHVDNRRTLTPMTARLSRTSRRTGRTILALWSVIVLGLLPIAAAASPSDPTWIAGIYDEADGDDVVALVADTVACKNDDTHTLLWLVCLPDELTSPTASAYEPLRTLTRDRGPPQALTKYTDSRTPSTPLRTSLLIAASRAISWPGNSSSASVASAPPSSCAGACPLLSRRGGGSSLDSAERRCECARLAHRAKRPHEDDWHDFGPDLAL